MTITKSISVRHNVEMAHRLFLTGGKCAQIHGHNWDVTLSLTGEVDSRGLLAGINFTDLKKLFRDYLDNTYDHRLLLNPVDPFAGPIVHSFEHDLIAAHVDTGKLDSLPGVQTMPGGGDPTTENFAFVIGEWAINSLSGEFTQIKTYVRETATNHAEWRWTL